LATHQRIIKNNNKKRQLISCRRISSDKNRPEIHIKRYKEMCKINDIMMTKILQTAREDGRNNEEGQ